jgi:hypothetical protein
MQHCRGRLLAYRQLSWLVSAWMGLSTQKIESEGTDTASILLVLNFKEG